MDEAEARETANSYSIDGLGAGVAGAGADMVVMAPSPTRSDARRADDSVAAAARNLTVPLAEPLSAGCDAESLNEAVAAPVGERPVSLLLRLKDIEQNLMPMRDAATDTRSRWRGAPTWSCCSPV